MNKALHVFVYLFLVLAGAGLWFEIQLNDKRQLLTDRNRMQEDYFVRVAKTIEKADAEKEAVLELKKDSDPVEAKIIDIPNTENLLAEYNNTFERTNLETYDWDNQNSRSQLRMVYVLDDEGKPVMDGNIPLMRGRGTEQELLDNLFESSKSQQSRLNNTRAELEKLRHILEGVVDELNKLKPIARQDKVTIEEKKAEIAKLEEEKKALEETITKLKSQIEELNAEVTNLKDQVLTAKNETEEAKEELDKQVKLVESLKKLLREATLTKGAKSQQGTAVTSLPSGDKGKIIEADNGQMFAIVEFTEEAINQLKGNNADAILPAIELGIRRAGYKGAAGEFVGRIRIRQEVKGKPYVICDILSAWEQDKLVAGDIVFAD